MVAPCEDIKGKFWQIWEFWGEPTDPICMQEKTVFGPSMALL